MTVALNLFSGMYTFVAEWFVLVNRRWPVPFDAALHFSREAILAAFVAVWLHRWLRTLQPALSPLSRLADFPLHPQSAHVFN